VVFDEEGIEAIYAFIDKSIKKGKFSFDGIFCNTDLTAARVIKHLKDKGISIPQDVQVIGYDGIKNFGFEDYYCSTIRQPLKEMAMTAVDIIIGNNSRSTPSLVCLPVTYCYGGTTRK
jgi:LacI family transcriptional regulator